MADGTPGGPAERCYFLRLRSANVIEAKGYTDTDAFAHLQETAGDGLVQVDKEIYDAAELGGKYAKSTKKLTPPPPFKPPEGIIVIRKEP